jgi:hypothetical protein
LHGVAWCGRRGQWAQGEGIQTNIFHDTLLEGKNNGSKTNGPGLQSTRAVLNTIA